MAAFSSNADNLVPGDRNNQPDVFMRDRRKKRTILVSVGLGGRPADDVSWAPSVSADGRFVAFASFASNLVPGDTNGTSDVFVRDLRAGTTTRVSVGTGGGQANDTSVTPSISADGRFVAFASYASNLVPDDTNRGWEVFVRDRYARTTTRISVGPGGRQVHGNSDGPSISADGRFVAFASDASDLVARDTNGERDIFVHDRRKHQTMRVSVGPRGLQANSGSEWPSISPEGGFVGFRSHATNLVPNDTNGQADIFLHVACRWAHGLDRAGRWCR
jgi:Tol biopolymer transport system component